MATQFDTMFQSGFAMLLQLHGEPVFYVKQDGTKRSVNAIVDRQPPVQFDAAGNRLVASMVVRMHLDETLGAIATEINTRHDKMLLPVKTGGVAELRAITQVSDTEGGAITLAVA